LLGPATARGPVSRTPATPFQSIPLYTGHGSQGLSTASTIEAGGGGQGLSAASTMACEWKLLCVEGGCKCLRGGFGRPMSGRWLHGRQARCPGCPETVDFSLDDPPLDHPTCRGS